MQLPRFRSTLLASAALAGVIALSVLVGPALLPADIGGAVARAEVTVDINVFDGALSPYGRWYDSPRYGHVWYPTNVRQGWRPYYDDGHWAYSDDDGWMWVSDASWGWAPFHYGRWAFDPQYGWVWVPGRVWGPAWVAFRQDNDYIGWAPLPPDAGWDPGYGYRGGNSINIDISFWSFVRPEGFTARRFDRYAVDRHQYPTIITRTTNITNITVINNRVVNNSFAVNDVERFTHQRVERFKVTESDHPQGTVIKGNNVVFYKPAVLEQGQANADANAKPQPAVSKEDPAQDNKKRVVRADAQANPPQTLEQNKKPGLNQNQGGNALPVANTTGDQPNAVQTLEMQKKRTQNKDQNVPTNGVSNTGSLSVDPKTGQPSNGVQPNAPQTLEIQKKKQPLNRNGLPIGNPDNGQQINNGEQNPNAQQLQDGIVLKKQPKPRQQQPLDSGLKVHVEQPPANTTSKKQVKLQRQDQQQQHQQEQGSPSTRKGEACGNGKQMPC
jgi:hypothetical protein